MNDTETRIEDNSHPWRDESILRELYHEGGLSTEEIGEELGVSQKTILNWMDKHDIKRRSKWYRDGEYRDKEKLRRLYFDEGLTVNEIAERIDAGVTTVYNWMGRHGFDLPGKDEKFKQRRRSEPADLRNHPGGYVRWRDTITEDTVYVHQLLAISHGEDPHIVLIPIMRHTI